MMKMVCLAAGVWRWLKCTEHNIEEIRRVGDALEIHATHDGDQSEFSNQWQAARRHRCACFRERRSSDFRRGAEQCGSGQNPSDGSNLTIYRNLIEWQCYQKKRTF